MTRLLMFVNVSEAGTSPTIKFSTHPDLRLIRRETVFVGCCDAHNSGNTGAKYYFGTCENEQSVVISTAA